MHGEPIAAETLWSCTTCGACADVCPLGISPMRMITDMRRYLIGEGALRGSPAVALQKTDRAGNPWGLSPADRFAWADGLDVPLASKHADFEVLYWVGCAAAYDRRVQKVARSVVRLLQAANVNFAVLGPEERCTGESARRMGDELLVPATGRAQRRDAGSPQRAADRRPLPPLREQPAQRLPASRRQLRSRPPQPTAGRAGRARAARSGRVTECDGDGRDAITYHDPCYLARANGITEAPRAVLAARDAAPAASLPIVELPRNRRQTSCCGGGGGRMWFDDALAQRVGQGRVREIAAIRRRHRRRLVPVLPDHAGRRPRRAEAGQCESATLPKCWPTPCWGRNRRLSQSARIARRNQRTLDGSGTGTEHLGERTEAVGVLVGGLEDHEIGVIIAEVAVQIAHRIGLAGREPEQICCCPLRNCAQSAGVDAAVAVQIAEQRAGRGISNSTTTAR